MGAGGVSDADDGPWLTLSEFERAFWSEADRIRGEDPKLESHGRFFVARNPSRSSRHPGNKHFNEWLPLLMFLKHEAGQFRNWDQTLLVSPSQGPDRLTTSGQNFDACVRFLSHQRDFTPDRQVWIEIVRAVSEKRSREMMVEDRALSRGESPSLKGSSLDEEMAEYKAAVTHAIRQKAGKPYPDPTILIVWLPQVTSPWLNQVLDTLNVEALLARGGAIRGVCVVGESTGCRWIFGSGI